MRIAAAIIVILNVAAVQASDLGTSRILGTWNIADGRSERDIVHSPARFEGPLVITERRISWTSENKRRCVVGYRVVSHVAAPMYPGGPIENSNAADAYTILTLELEQQECDQNIASFAISLAQDEKDFAHWAAFNGKRATQGYGAMHQVSSNETSP